MIQVRVREMAAMAHDDSELVTMASEFVKKMTQTHFAVKTLQRRVRGSMARKQVAELIQAKLIQAELIQAELIQAANTITGEECIDLLENKQEDIQKLNKEKKGKLKFPIFIEKFKQCENTPYILDLGNQTLSDIISKLIDKDILKKTNGESYGPDHWGRKSGGYSSYMKSYSNIVTRYIGQESKININELVHIIYDLMQTEIFINAYGTWVKGDTTRKDEKTTRNAKPNNCPKQILQWLMMIIMVITDNA